LSATADWIVAVSTAASAVFIGTASLLAVRQLKEAHTGNRLMALARVTDTLIASPIMEARQWVYANEHELKTTHLDELTESNRWRAETVWRAYSRVGLLFDHNLIVDERPVLDMWGHAIERTYEILEPLLTERRDGDNPNFAHHFSTLYERSKAFNRRNQ
jgi:hypothetical protein